MKMSQIATENDKNLKIFQVSRIFPFFSKCWRDFEDWNVEKGKKGKNVLSSEFFEELLQFSK